jgi:hypothetical protein
MMHQSRPDSTPPWQDAPHVPFPVDFARAGATSWEQQIGGWLREVAHPRAIFD